MMGLVFIVTIYLLVVEHCADSTSLEEEIRELKEEILYLKSKGDIFGPDFMIFDFCLN